MDNVLFEAVRSMIDDLKDRFQRLEHKDDDLSDTLRSHMIDENNMIRERLEHNDGNIKYVIKIVVWTLIVAGSAGLTLHEILKAIGVI